LKTRISKLLTKRNLIIAGAVILIVLIAAGGFLFGKGKPKTDETGFGEYKVAKDDIAVVISGSGTIEANEQYDITSLVTGDVLSADFEEGDQVNEGDILYQIDTESVQNSIARAENSVENARMSHEDALEQVANLNVSSKLSGVVTAVHIKEGDTISKGAKIADVVDDSVMVLKIPFNSNDAQNLYSGQSITVRLDASGYEMDGTISRISTGATSSSTGVSVKYVEIKVNNPGTLKKGEKAIAYTPDYACNEAGTLDVLSEGTITAQSSGDVDSLLITQGDKVDVGQTVAVLTSKSVTDAARKSSLSYSDARLNLDNLYEGMEDYTIKAPISGTVINKTTKAGDKLDNTNKSTVMAVVADMSRMLFDISVDELDIAKLKVGQSVSITADALEGKIFDGYIDKISIIGTTSNGVTTYPVTVVVNEPEGLIPGMNVDANITVQEVKDVLSVPVSAIMRGNMVAVKTDGKSSEQKETKGEEKGNSNTEGNKGTATKGENSKQRAFGKDLPEGFELRRVEVGLSNSDSVEIVSGLKEGDVVLIQQTEATSIMNMMMNGRPSGGMGGGPMGGAMPSGGMGGNRTGGNR